LRIFLITLILQYFDISESIILVRGFKIVDETCKSPNKVVIPIEHQVLVDVPDLVKSIREQDIIEDDHHNVETVGTGDGDLDDESGSQS